VNKRVVRKKRSEKVDVKTFIIRVNEAALPRLESCCRDWTTGGKRIGREFIALNPTRNDTKAGSFKINLHTGQWADFATGDAGGDPVSLYAYLFNMTQFKAAKSLADKIGVPS